MSSYPTRSRRARRRHDETVPDQWRRWRRSRPLPAGTMVMSAGLCLLLLPAGTFSVVLLPGLAGTSGFLFGAGLAILGLFLVLQPRSHAFAGAAAMLVAITSLVTTNLGGFGLGLTLGVLGGAWGLAWTPDVEDSHRPRSTSGGPSGTPNQAEPPTSPIPSSRHKPSIRR